MHLLYILLQIADNNSESSGYRELFQGLFGLMLMIGAGIYARWKIRKNKEKNNTNE